jgi:hypothetical protein
MRTIAAIALVAACLSSPVEAAPADEAQDLYRRFLAAQNARDLHSVRDLLLEGPRFLWVSDGKTFWGRSTMIERMASFQQAEVWRVEPDLEKAVPVEVNEAAAYLHLPLTLVIGASSGPDRLRFLVSMLTVHTPDGWRIAALLTTTEKPE